MENAHPLAPAAAQRRRQIAFLSAEAVLPLALLNCLFAGMVVLILWRAVTPSVLVGWALVVVAISGLDVFVRLKLRARAEATVVVNSPLLIGTDVLIGCLWLFAALVFFPTSQPELLFYFLFAIGAPALCTAVYQHYFLRSCFLRIGVALPAAALLLLTTNSRLAVVQAAVLLLIWATIIWLVFKLHTGLMQRLELADNRDTLLRQVAQSAHQLDLLRANEAKSRAVAEDANAAKSRFLAHSSHDLRQPLHAIRLLLETIDDTAIDAESRHVIGRVRHSIDALGKLFDSLLDLTLLDTGQMRVQEDHCALRNLLQEVVRDFAELARSNNVTLGIDVPDLAVRADPTIVLRMVQNLTANAIRHSKNGTVTLRGRRDDSGVWIDVIDTGTGIAKKDQNVIFKEFESLADAAVDSSAHLGLGLSIVSRLATLTGIEVSLESEPGRGSVFSLGPIALGETESAALDQRRPSRAPLKGLDIVVLDDDSDTLEATGKLLRKWGLNVSLAQTADQLDASNADLLVCDVELGTGPDGIEVVHDVLADVNPNIKALLISGNTTDDLARRAARSNLTLLHKPVQPAQLKSAILTLIGTH